MTYVMTDEHKRKIAEGVRRGNFIKCRVCNKRVWAAPWALKREHPKQYCGRECFKTYYRTHHSKVGEDNYFWNGGAYRFKRNNVLQRDNWTCKKCGIRDKLIMQVDHIKPRSRGGSNAPDNLQTLCPNCHAKKTWGSQRSAGK